MVTATDEHPLDNPAWHSLVGAHAQFGTVSGAAARYFGDVAPFLAVADNAGPQCWADLEQLCEPGETIVLVDAPAGAPQEWTLVNQIEGVQLTGEAFEARVDPEAVELGVDDVPEMLDLVERTKPGPFRQRTIELGRYLGFRVDGALVAMAGERLRPQGWTEISAVCTDDAFRGRGYATRLMRTVAAGIRDRGELPFLHASANNLGAIGLYESLGFVLRRPRVFSVWQLPPAAVQ